MISLLVRIFLSSLLEVRMKTIAKAIMLMVGTALLGRPGLANRFQLQRRESRTASMYVD